MPSEWLGVHGGRSYGPVSRGSSLPGPAVPGRYVPIIYIINVPAMRHTIPYSIIPGYRTVPV